MTVGHIRHLTPASEPGLGACQHHPPGSLATEQGHVRWFPLTLIVMDTDILADERAVQRRFRRIYRSILMVLLAGGCVALIWGGWRNSPRAGIVVTVSVVVIIAGLVALIVSTGRRRPGDVASTGPWSWGQVYTGSTSKQCWNAMSPIVTRHQMSFRRLTRTTGMAERPGGLLYRKGYHLVDVRPSQDYPGWQVITVQSAPDLPTTVTDFGRGRSLNHAFLKAVPGFRTPEQMAEQYPRRDRTEVSTITPDVVDEAPDSSGTPGTDDPTTPPTRE